MAAAPKTTRQFRRAAEAGVARANPDAADLALDWVHGPVAVTWADGTRGFSGVMQTRASGYQSQRVVATLHDSRLTVR